jgi:hypothetical protein
LARQTLPDGRSAYIDALKSTLGNDVQSSLENVPDSSSIQPRFSGENQLLTIPSSPDRPFLFGKTGKETSIQIAMTNDQWDLLFTLAWYRKGLELKPDSNEVSLLPSGWVKLNDSGQMTQAKQFATALADAGLPLIEITGDVYVRIAVEKSNLFFDDDLYSYSLDREGDKDGILEVSTHEINTRWGTIHSSKVAVPITKNICRIITAIQQEIDPISQPNIRGEDLQRDLREKIDTRTRKIGLRKFIRIESGQHTIAPISAP